MEQVKQFYNWIKNIDPRYIVITNHILLMGTAIIFLDLRREWEQIALAVVVALGTELILSKITMKQKKFDLESRVLSSLVLALSTILLVRSSYWWFYGFIALVGVLSKYIIVNHEGRHIYNPTNVAIVFSLLVLPAFIQVRPDSFTTHIFSLGCILFFGTWAIIRAKSWRMTLGYFGGICLIGYPASLIMDYPFLLIIGPELNVGVILFAFLMITDPITSPRNHNLQWLFGFSIAAVNLILRYEQLYYSQFIALFIVLSFTSVFLKHRDSIFNAVRSYSRA
jgi:Na+-translocating ferredoxin:NAD+ oxidoreductase RnfD subunit